MGVVPHFTEKAKQSWEGWSEAGAQVRLRPHWWHVGGVAPVLPLHRQGNFFKFAQSHQMIGFDFDSLMGYWGTQGPMYYVIARLSVHPEMSVDDVIDEYSSAFGNAAPDIKSYLNYWEQFTKRAGYRYGKPSEDGSLNTIIQKHRLDPYYGRNGWQVIPYLYTDDVLDKAYGILNQADLDAANDNTFVKQRIQFLRDGLDHLKLTRDVLELGYKQRYKDYGTEKVPSDLKEQFRKLSTQLQQMRHSLTLKNVIWGEAEYSTEEHRSAPTAEGFKPYIKGHK